MGKKWFFYFLLAMACLSSAALAEGGRDVISPQEVQSRLDACPYISLLDVRDREAYDAGHIPYAASFPLSSLRADMKRILDSGFSSMETEMIVYGASPEDGRSAAAILRRLGFTRVWRLSSLDEWTGEIVSSEAESRLLGGLNTSDIYGNPVDASMLSGCRLTLVNVWATYSRPCVNEMADLGRLSEEMKEKGVQVVGLVSDVVGAFFTADESQLNKARTIVEQAGAAFPQLLPSKDLYWKVIGQIDTVPTAFFVDETGRRVGPAYAGARSYDDWKRITEEMLEKSE